MSVVPMKLLTIAGPLERFDDVVRACVIDQEFHPENALQLMRSVKGLRPLELENPYSALLHRSVEVADEAGIPLAYAPSTPLPLGGFRFLFRFPLRAHRRPAPAEGGAGAQGRRGPQHGGPAPEPPGTQRQPGRALGPGSRPVPIRLPAPGDLRRLPGGPQRGGGHLFVPTTLGARRVYGVYFTTKEAHHKVDSCSIPCTLYAFVWRTRPAGRWTTPRQSSTPRWRPPRRRWPRWGRSWRSCAKHEREHILSSYSYLRYHSECCGLRQYACRSKGTFTSPAGCKRRRCRRSRKRSPGSPTCPA
ncbi:hypothetical protein M5E87_14350 [Flavonifractor plautii]|nr:hypothetical protein M5E87_14350 [Flavonifractor plautii]